MWLVVLVRISWFLVAVYFISEPIKFAIFEHNYVFISQLQVLICFHAVLDIALLYCTSCYTTIMDIARGHLGHGPLAPILPILQEGDSF